MIDIPDDIERALRAAGLQRADESAPSPLPLRCTCGHDAFEIVQAPDTIQCVGCRTTWRGLALKIPQSVPVISVSSKVDV